MMYNKVDDYGEGCLGYSEVYPFYIRKASFKLHSYMQTAIFGCRIKKFLSDFLFFLQFFFPLADSQIQTRLNLDSGRVKKGGIQCKRHRSGLFILNAIASQRAEMSQKG